MNRNTKIIKLKNQGQMIQHPVFGGYRKNIHYLTNYHETNYAQIQKLKTLVNIHIILSVAVSSGMT